MVLVIEGHNGRPLHERGTAIKHERPRHSSLKSDIIGVITCTFSVELGLRADGEIYPCSLERADYNVTFDPITTCRRTDDDWARQLVGVTTRSLTSLS